MNNADPNSSPDSSSHSASFTPAIEAIIEPEHTTYAAPGRMTLPVRAGFVIVNGFTSFNLMIGVLSLIVASSGHEVLAAWGLLLCVLLDSCDGSLARRWRVTSEFGAQLDSLADMTSFIIASVALTYAWAQSTTPFPLLMTVCGLYALAGAFRLARFNSSPEDRGFFAGIQHRRGRAAGCKLSGRAAAERIRCDCAGRAASAADDQHTTIPQAYKLAPLPILSLVGDSDWRACKPTDHGVGRVGRLYRSRAGDLAVPAI